MKRPLRCMRTAAGLMPLALWLAACGASGPAAESGTGTAGMVPAPKAAVAPPVPPVAAPAPPPAAAMAPPPPPPASGPPAPAPGGAPMIDPAAIQALERMGAYLRLLEAFEVQATTSTDVVVEPGLKVQLDGKASLQVRRPDRLHLATSSDRKQREIYFDGKNFTLVAPRLKYYAVTPAPPTLGGLYDTLTEYGIEMPLADLFLWGAARSPKEGVTLAIAMGPAVVDGVQTEHYLIGEKDVSWQVWIASGKEPLPRKLVITTLSEPQQPQYVARLRWNTVPRLDERNFVYHPGPDAVRIRQAPPESRP